MPNKGRKGFEVANMVLAVMFFVAALLQYNDPDPVVWMALYGGAAAACLLAWRVRVSWLVSALVGAVALVWAGALAPRVIRAFVFSDLFRSMEAKTPSIEYSREFLGLLIVAAWMTVLTAGSLGRRRSGALPQQ